MEVGEVSCPACGGDGWRDWPVMPCHACEGSGLAVPPVSYLRSDDRPRMYANAPFPAPQRPQEPPQAVPGPMSTAKGFALLLDRLTRS